MPKVRQKSLKSNKQFFADEDVPADKEPPSSGSPWPKGADLAGGVPDGPSPGVPARH
jgi:hypothetical protein